MNLQQCAIAFCIAKTSTLNICYLSILSGLSMLCRGSNLLYNLTIEMLTATFCRAALSHMFVIRPNIADLGFSQVFAKGRTSSTLQVWTFVVFVLTVLKYEQNTWFQIIMAWYDISSRFDQNCGLWLIESWKSSPTFGWNDQLTIIKGGDLLKQCHSFVDWWESTCSYIAQIVGPRPPLIQMWRDIRGTNLAQRGGV